MTHLIIIITKETIQDFQNILKYTSQFLESLSYETKTVLTGGIPPIASIAVILAVTAAAATAAAVGIADGIAVKK